MTSQLEASDVVDGSTALLGDQFEVASMSALAVSLGGRPVSTDSAQMLNTTETQAAATK